MVELPADLLQFGEPAGIGAYVRLRGSDDDARIVCNPVDRPGLDDTGRAQLLTHEAVHAVTRSPARVAPGWVVEGYAEHGAERAFPDLEASNATLLPTDPDAAALPSDQAVAAGDLAVYALAARAVAGAQERWGRGSDRRLVRRLAVAGTPRRRSVHRRAACRPAALIHHRASRLSERARRAGHTRAADRATRSTNAVEAAKMVSAS